MKSFFKACMLGAVASAVSIQANSASRDLVIVPLYIHDDEQEIWSVYCHMVAYVLSPGEFAEINELTGDISVFERDTMRETTKFEPDN